ncbi:Endonuclease domain-containing 1 protein [Labeo rohita]|uniref:Endonuclease domain-containing 1 protein n=1 Tax=Labeo rohita TaxID=84645 RepID=A0ABQ8MIY0_LABRO|nr:Endonuclease domain-containing 1 protein [Labeo rohita]
MALCKIYIFRLLLLTGLRLAGGTVSDSFKECSQFFYMHTAPTGIRGGNLKRICQRYGDKVRYATLYDSSHRLALYSAYTFKKSDSRNTWLSFYSPPTSEESISNEIKTVYWSHVYCWSRFGTFLIPLMCLILRSQAGVVDDFSQVDRCKDFLYMGTPPRGYLGTSLKKICQRYVDKPRYVTLYDPQKHIPVYSAYTFKKSDGEKRVDIPWMFEPQLATEKGSSNMEPFPQSALMHKNFEDTQAVLEDYADVVQYERGQMNPDEHQADPLDKAATYTLTNVVPLIREFNFGPWSTQVEVTRKRLNNYCHGKAYVITGVTTSGNMIRRDNLNRVAVPEFMWTAYCCTDYDHNAPYSERYKFPAFGAYGLNDRVNNHIVEVPIKNLEKFLKGKMEVDKNFQIFYSDCVSDV